jgi:hypothetical protein
MTCCGRSCVERQFIMSTTPKRKTSPFRDSINHKKPTRTPPELKARKRPEITMLISFRSKKNIPARVLHDSGCTTSIASERWIEELNVPFVTHKEQKEIQNFAGDIVEDCGWCYPFPITCQHGDHYSKETFEIGPMEDSCDLILPYWWIVKHKARGFANGGKISFESEEC